MMPMPPGMTGSDRRGAEPVTIGPDFGQPVFAGDKIFARCQNRGLIVYGPAAGPAATALTPARAS